MRPQVPTMVPQVPTMVPQMPNMMHQVPIPCVWKILYVLPSIYINLEYKLDKYIK